MLGGFEKVYDISPEISPAMAVFPGDTPFQRKIILDVQKGDSLGLSSFTTTPHLGAHVDAPNHYSTSGVGISERSLHFYMGPCQVISVNLNRGERIKVEHIQKIKIRAHRVLFYTGSFPNPNVWNSDFNALSAELVDYLFAQKICLVGIDTPSIDLAEDQALESHKRIHAHDMAILEGVVLDQVPDGIYTLCALPLKMKGADASPVRAVLLQ
ncbi:MAG: cyclase family protein [Bdellovibrionales bacterium]|nr:cyclase family protein [Bdellovibrionales bacterium]